MGVSRLSAWLTVLGMLFTANVLAETNPFKKTKNYLFGDDFAWYVKDGAAIKSGTETEGGSILYYHLNVSKTRLRMRFGKNDPGGELSATREFENLEVVDVKVDGFRLKRFQQCLDTQATIAPTLKQGSIVSGGICVNAGGGDFVILLDDETRDRLMRAKNLEFVVAPYGRPMSLAYTMSGFANGFGPIIAPPPPPPPPPPVVEAPKPKTVIKTCFADAPEEFRATVKSIAYICDDQGKKDSAEASIKSQVKAERKKRDIAEAERKREDEARLKEETKRKSLEDDFAKKEAEMWVSRCQKHWAKGTSPCYCAPYIDRAPAGVVNACAK